MANGYATVREGRSTRRRASVVLTSTAVLLGSLIPAVTMLASPAGATSTTSTSPTPPDLFVAYAPLVSQGNTPGADTVQSYNTSTLEALTDPTAGASASLGSAQVGAQPIAEAVSPDGGTAYVLNSASDSITPVETLSNPPQVESSFSLPSGYTPTAIAVSPDGNDAYVVGYPTVSNSLTPALWEITLTGASPGTLARTILLPTTSSPAGIAITPNGLTALVTDYSGGDVLPITLSNGAVGTPISVGEGPLGIQVSPNGNDAYVANSEDGTVSEIVLSDDTANSPATTLEVGFLPQQVAVDPTGSTLWVTEDNATAPGNAGFVVPVSIPSMTVGSPITVGYDPNGVALSPDGSTVFVADETNGYGVGHSEGALSLVNTTSDAATTVYTSIDPDAVVVTPDQAPVASFTSEPEPAGTETCFDASASYSLTTTGPTSTGLSYSWNFGDGTVSPPATAKDDYNVKTCHPFALPGNYTVTVAVSDASGTSTEQIYTGQYVLNNGGPSAGQSSTVVIPAATINSPPIAFVANALANEVTPVLAVPTDASEANVAGTPVGVGTHPDAIAITPNGRTAYVANFGSDNVTPIDVATDTAAPSGAWIPVGSEPDAVAITPDGSTLIVANSGDGTVSIIATSTNQVVDTLTLGGSPSGIAISPDGTTAYVTDNAPGYNDMLPINLSTDAVGSPIPAGTDPEGVAITPDGTTAFVVDRGNAIVPGAVTPITLGSSPSVGTAVDVGTAPDAVAINPDGDDVYVANYTSGTVTQIALTDDVPGTVTASNAGSDPTGLAVTPDGGALYVADDVPGAPTSTGTLSMLLLPTAGGVPGPISVPAGADAVAITPDQAPVAALRVVAAPSSEPSYFDAGQSTFPSAGPASYSWDFGDGTGKTTTVDHVTHTYAEGGDFTASVTITDADGTSTTQVFTGQTVSLNGGRSAQATANVSVPYVVPTITGVTPNSGDAGDVTSVIISGQNLFGITTVDVGGVPVTGWTANNAGTEISNVLTPDSLPAGTVDVTVANPGGTSAITPADTFTYLSTSTPPDGAPTVTALSDSAGPLAGGTGVTITGTNLTGATAVDFGSTPATSFTVNGAGTQITAVSPAATTPGTVDVTVVTPVATSAVSPFDAFTYLAPTPPSTTPTVTLLSPTSGPDAGLTSVTITGTNFTNVTGVSFGAVAAESYVVNSDVSITAVSPAVATPGTVDVTVSTLAGTSAVSAGDAFTYENGVASAGPVVSSVTPASGPISGGNTVVIDGSNFTDLAPNAVKFGGTSATYSVNSAGTVITASAPSTGAPVSVDVVVSNPLGYSEITSGDVYTYLPDATFVPVVTSISPNSGLESGGTSVTLTGSDLTGVTDVWFGTTDVTSFTTNGTGTSITVDSPSASQAGTVSVTATSPEGTSAATAADAFTYLSTATPPDGSPTITSVAPAEGSVSGDTGVVITGTNFTDASAVDFGGVAAASYSVNSAGTQIDAVSPSSGAADSVDITVTADALTSPITTADVFTYLAGPPPPGPIVTSIAPDSGPLTGGTVVTVTGTNLADPILVDVGPTPGTDVSVNSAGTSLSVTTPSSTTAGPVSIVVVTSAGSSTTSSGSTFTYIQPTSAYTPVTPKRLLDTRRTGEGGPFGAHVTRTLTIAGANGVPLDATGVLVNLTVTDTTSATNVFIYPAGGVQPASPSNVVAKGETVAHLEEVPLGTGGALSISNSAGSAQIVVDLQGYYTAGPATSGGYVALPASTIYSTATKAGGGAIVSGKPRKIVVTGVGGVPKSHVAAVLFYLSASQGTKSSFATVWPAGVSEPNSSVLNWLPGQGVTNLVQMDVGSGGAIELANEYGSAQFKLTVVGYITAAGATSTGALNLPLGAATLYSGSTHPGTPVTLTIGGSDSVPVGAAYAVLDVTVANPSTASTITLGAQGSSVGAQVIGAPVKATTSEMVIVPLAANGDATLSIAGGSATVTVSLQGYEQ